MKSNYTVIIYTPQDLNHSSYIQSGLFELEKTNFINCVIKLNLKKRVGRISTETGKCVFSAHPQKKTSYYKLINNLTKEEIKFATDLYDIPHFFSDYALKNCDYIFKRNFQSKYIAPIKKYSKAEILPLGLSFGVQSIDQKSSVMLQIAHFISELNFNFKVDRNLFKRLYKTFKITKKHREYVTKGRSLDLFTNFNIKLNLKVFYQVRCFPELGVEDVKELHYQRSTLVRTLKRRLKNNFIGGLVQSDISNKYYPDCITDQPSDPVSYVNLIKDNSICIYTRGLSNSPARKLPEYLSQGKCIVAERYFTELPVPLENGKNIMYFDTIEQCADICEALLLDAEKVRFLSINARRYYEDFIQPKENVKRILDIMITKLEDSNEKNNSQS